MRASQVIVGLLLLAMGAAVGYAWRVLGRTFALVVVLLALVSFLLGILYERHRRKPGRPPEGR